MVNRRKFDKMDNMAVKGYYSSLEIPALLLTGSGIKKVVVQELIPEFAFRVILGHQLLEVTQFFIL